MNWQILVNELMAAGITQVQMAQECGCSQSSISDLRSGSIEEPRYAIGQKLIQLHKSKVLRSRKASKAEA